MVVVVIVGGSGILSSFLAAANYMAFLLSSLSRLWLLFFHLGRLPLFLLLLTRHYGHDEFGRVQITRIVIRTRRVVRAVVAQRFRVVIIIVVESGLCDYVNIRRRFHI